MDRTTSLTPMKVTRQRVLNLKKGNALCTSKGSWKIESNPEAHPTRGVKVPVRKDGEEYPTHVFFTNSGVFKTSAGKEIEELNLHLVGIIN